MNLARLTLATTLVLLGFGHAQIARATDGACRDRPDALGDPLVALRVDNDLFAERDYGYSSGVQLSLVSPNLASFTDDPCLPAFARWLNTHLARVRPSGFDQQNMVVKFSQATYTPLDRERRDLIVDDRPYAGILMLTLGYNARVGDALRTTQLGIGLVGPHAYAEQTQDFIHSFTRSRRFQGWDNQLDDELLLMLLHERAYRVAFHPIGDHGLQWDGITHWGGAIGNYQTQANAGFELRLGVGLPNDFGSSTVRPTGDNTAPAPGGARHGPGWAWNVFLAADARLVLRDITLDGNTFRDSHSVDKEPVVGEAALGFAISRGPWRLAMARYFRSREFEQQSSLADFGTLTLSREF